MALPSWPAIRDAPLVDGFQSTPWSNPAIVTDFEAGNQRQRRRPGDKVTTIVQTIPFNASEIEVFKDWFETTIAGGTARFTMNVWSGSAFVNKVCQFDLKNPHKETFVSKDRTNVAMTLRVYGL